jgi:hypothetical protein
VDDGVAGATGAGADGAGEGGEETHRFVGTEGLLG